MNLKQLGADLTHYQLPLTLGEAREYLAQANSRLNLVNLYQDYFPEKWQSSKTGLELPLGEANGYTPREVEFLELCETLFPFASHYLIELAEEGEYLDEIPVYSLEIDWLEAAPTDFNPSIQILLLLTGCAELNQQLTLPAEYITHLNEFRAEVITHLTEYSLFPPHFYLEGTSSYSETDESWFPYFTVDNPALSEECTKRTDPLSLLPVALAAIFHESGCAMLDATDEIGIEAYWDTEDLAWLVQETQKAEEILGQITELGEWLLSDLTHLKEVTELWKRVHLKIKNDKNG